MNIHGELVRARQKLSILEATISATRVALDQLERLNVPLDPRDIQTIASAAIDVSLSLERLRALTTTKERAHE